MVACPSNRIDAATMVLYGRMRRLYVAPAPQTRASASKSDLGETERWGMHVGLFGDDYGSKDSEGVSPTEREFGQATAIGVHGLVFLKAVAGILDMICRCVAAGLGQPAIPMTGGFVTTTL